MSDRNQSKQRRAAQNKAAREALANRKTRAALGPSTDRPVPPPLNGSATQPVAATGRTRGRIKGPVGQAGRPARTAPVRQARTPTNPISAFIAEVQAQPGGKAVFFSLMFSIAAAILILCTRVTSEEVMHVPGLLIATYRQKNHLAPPAGLSTKPRYATDYALAILGPFAAVLAIAPVVITGATATLVRRGSNVRRNVTTGVVFLMIIFFFSTAIEEFMLFTVGAMIFAMFQARKADPPPIRARKPKKGDVIEATAIEDEDGVDDDYASDEYDHEG